MATYWLINTVVYAGYKVLPGTKLDSVTDPASYNGAVNAGGELVPTSDATVTTAAALAASAKLRGANEAELEAIMRTGVDKSQGDQKGASASTSDLASTATGAGAALMGIEDAAAVITATTVEGALAELAGLRIQKRTVVIGEADLTGAVNGTAQVLNVGAVLPAGAVVLGHEVNVATLFSGGGATAVKVDLGGTAPTAIVSQMDVFTGAATGALSPRTGAHAQGLFSAQQLTATFTPDAGHSLVNLTAGSLTIAVWFLVPA